MTATPSAGFRQIMDTEPDVAIWRAMKVAEDARLARSRPAEGNPLPAAPLTSTGAMRAIGKLPEEPAVEVPVHATGPEAAGRLLKAMQDAGWPPAVASDLTPPASGEAPAFPRRPAGAWDAYKRGEWPAAPVPPAGGPAPYTGRHGASAFNPKRGTSDTGSFPALPRSSASARVLERGTPVDLTMEPVIGDRMAVPLSFRPEQPEAGVVLYAGPDWARAYMRARLAAGEWESPFQAVKPGWGRNAADEAVARVNVRENIARAARRLCRAIGQPDQAAALLARVREIELAGDAQ